MATGIRISPTAIPDKIELTMSLLEAQTLKQLFQYVGGDPNTSARKHTDALNTALIAAKVRSAEHPLVGSPDFFFDDEERSTL